MTNVQALFPHDVHITTLVVSTRLVFYGHISTTFVLQALQVIMMEDSSAEKAALQHIWPTARQLLCHCNVAQAQSRWLTASCNKVDKDFRCDLMSAFQEAGPLKSYLALRHT